jgi:hypothetical protein
VSFGGTVGWSDLIGWRDPRIKATVVGVAAALAEAIIESTNRLQARLRDEGFAWKDPARADTDECLLECTIFEWFLRDIAVLDGFGTQAEATRQALAGRVLIDLQRSGMSTTCLEGFEGGCRERFAEYAEALDMSLSLQPLGALAWRRISGREEPSERMTMLLAMRASGELLALRGLARNYRLVDLPQSPSRAGQE